MSEGEDQRENTTAFGTWSAEDLEGILWTIQASGYSSDERYSRLATLLNALGPIDVDIDEYGEARDMDKFISQWRVAAYDRIRLRMRQRLASGELDKYRRLLRADIDLLVNARPRIRERQDDEEQRASDAYGTMQRHGWTSWTVNSLDLEMEKILADNPKLDRVRMGNVTHEQISEDDELQELHRFLMKGGKPPGPDVARWQDLTRAYTEVSRYEAAAAQLQELYRLTRDVEGVRRKKEVESQALEEIEAKFFESLHAEPEGEKHARSTDDDPEQDASARTLDEESAPPLLSNELAVAHGKVKDLRQKVTALQRRQQGRPSIPEMIDLIEKHRFKTSPKTNLTAIGRECGVSGDTIKNWLQEMNLVRHAGL